MSSYVPGKYDTDSSSPYESRDTSAVVTKECNKVHYLAHKEEEKKLKYNTRPDSYWYSIVNSGIITTSYHTVDCGASWGKASPFSKAIIYYEVYI